MYQGCATIGHGCGSEVFYLGLALDPAYMEGFVEGALERIGEDEIQRAVVIESLKADCEVRAAQPS